MIGSGISGGGNVVSYFNPSTKKNERCFVNCCFVNGTMVFVQEVILRFDMQLFSIFSDLANRIGLYFVGLSWIP